MILIVEDINEDTDEGDIANPLSLNFHMYVTKQSSILFLRGMIKIWESAANWHKNATSK